MELTFLRRCFASELVARLRFAAERRLLLAVTIASTAAPTTATGIWYLTDVFINLREKLVTTGSALYRDEYVKQADGWRIKSSTYKRLYEIQEALESAPKLTAHYLANAAGREAIARATTR